MTTTYQVKELREKTGAGMMLCKEALESNSGDESKAIIWLRQKGIAIADGKSGRKTNEGIVGSYIHTGGKVGVLVEVLCETDFVSRSDEFKELVRNLGMQIAACPSVSYVFYEDIPEDVVASEMTIEMGNASLASKPVPIRQKIVEGRVGKHLRKMCLYSQPYIKDNSLTVEDYVKSVSGILQENLKVSRFVRLDFGVTNVFTS